jgi:hypothetical protein
VYPPAKAERKPRLNDSIGELNGIWEKRRRTEPKQYQKQKHVRLLKKKKKKTH